MIKKIKEFSKPILIKTLKNFKELEIFITFNATSTL